MPFHLPPLSRRRFITRSLAAVAGLTLERDAWAAAKPDPNRWALLADTHVAEDRTKIARETNMSDNLGAVGKELLGLAYRPAGVLVNGDCAFNTGEPGDYRTFTELLEPLRAAQMPIHVTLGNHDHREHIREAVSEARGAKRPVADKHVGLLRGEHANWFLLDSLELVNKTPGLLGDAQLAWLAKELDAHSDKPAIIFAHHNLNLQGGETKSALKDTEKLLEVLAPRKHVKAYVFGHTHTWLTQEHASGIHLVNLPPVGYVFDKKRPNGWVEATLHPDRIKLQLNALNREHPEHGQVKELKWR
ncbi:MAG: metallophosphoesterase [Verrucomicrobiota bacterium]